VEKEDDLVPLDTSERSDRLERVETEEKDRSEEVQESAGVGCSVGEGD
jgi:hypothetical protein